VRKAEAILLGNVGRRAIEVVASARDLQAVDGPKSRRRDGIEFVVIEASEEEVLVTEAMIDADIEAVAGLSFIWADDRVVG
jgi:hypothetical protein